MTAAMELARFGIPVRLVDKYTAPANTSRALAVQSRTVEQMQQRGLAEEMLRLGNRAFSATIFAENKQLGKVDLHQIDSRFNFILLLAQSETERILREHLEDVGILIERETELIAFSQREGSNAGVQATLRKPDGSVEEIEAAYLIDAEGAHSTVRHSMDLSFEGNSLPNTYALADLYIDGDLAEDQLSIFIAESGLLAAFPMGNHRFRIIATEKQAAPEGAPAPDLEHMRALWSQGSHLSVHFRDLQWSSRFRINSRALNQLRHGRIFFGGDSAHIHSPAGGQGMNTGIQDMINLGWKLAMVYRGYATERLLETYNEERLPIIHALVSTTERATDLFNSDSHIVHTLLRHALPLALSLKTIRRKGATIISELGGNYRESSLNGSTEGECPVHAGDRFPDVLVEEDSQTRVFDILDPSAFTTLKLGSGEHSDFRSFGHMGVLKTIARPSQALTSIVGKDAVAVVRPDGYLLYAGSPAYIAKQLDQWTHRWLLSIPA